MQQTFTRGRAVFSKDPPVTIGCRPVTLHEILSRHEPTDESEAEDLARIRAFVSLHPQPFDRSIAQGHLTASAMVLTADGQRVLLLFHHKLRRGLQPGGHAETGEAQGETVALREALEETGLPGLTLHPDAPRPLDVDVHDIPARPPDPAHEHLDLRYLVIADPSAAIQPAEGETTKVRWFSWDELPALDLDHGLRRALTKARYWCERARPGTS
jgi:8-oxo-dGTP pyrophosphatase MutT (NUDIX family)